MKLKTSLSLMLESLVNGDKERAQTHLSAYMKRKASGIVNEYDFDFDDDRDYDYDDFDKFNGTDDINEIVKLTVDGVEIKAKIWGTQQIAYHEEPATFHHPGSSEIYEYGTITLSSLEALVIAGQTVFDGADIFNDATAYSMTNKVQVYAKELYDCIMEDVENVGGIPQQVVALVTPEFCAKIVTALAKELKSREGAA